MGSLRGSLRLPSAPLLSRGRRSIDQACHRGSAHRQCASPAQSRWGVTHRRSPAELVGHDSQLRLAIEKLTGGDPNADPLYVEPELPLPSVDSQSSERGAFDPRRFQDQTVPPGFIEEQLSAQKALRAPAAEVTPHSTPSGRTALTLPSVPTALKRDATLAEPQSSNRLPRALRRWSRAMLAITIACVCGVGALVLIALLAAREPLPGKNNAKAPTPNAAAALQPAGPEQVMVQARPSADSITAAEARSLELRMPGPAAREKPRHDQALPSAATSAPPSEQPSPLPAKAIAPLLPADPFAPSNRPAPPGSAKPDPDRTVW